MQKTLRPERSLGIMLNRDNVAGYVFILPFIIGLVVFTVIHLAVSGIYRVQRAFPRKMGRAQEFQNDVL